MSDYHFIIDIESRRLIADYFSTEAGTPPTVIFGDQPTISVRLVEPNDNNAEWPWNEVDLTGQTIRVGIGSLENTTPSAYIELTDDVATPSSTVAVIRGGVLNVTSEIQSIKLTNSPIRGSYTITIDGEETTPLDVDSDIDSITDAVEALASFNVGDVITTGSQHDFTLEFDKALGDIATATVNVDNLRGLDKGKTGTIDLHVEELLTLLDDETSVEATLEVVRWTTADVAGETVLQVPVTVKQDIIPDTVPGTTPLPGYPVDLDQITQSGAVTGQIPQWNGSEWAAATVSGTGDLLSTANLSDLADIPTARTNLGLGTAATSSTGDFAAASHTHVASTDMVATGTPSSATFLRGDDVWATPAGGGGGDLLAANNLSDVGDAATSLSNLGGAALVHTHTSDEITNNTSESTGVLTGGVLSTGAGADEFSISDGTGQIVTAAGAVTSVSWSGKSNITPANLFTNLLTWVGIDSGGNVVEKVTAFTPNEVRNTVVLGVIVHTDNVTVQAVNNQQVVAYQPLSSTVDVANAIGFVNISGNQFTANGATMTTAKSAGVLFKFGSNYDSDQANPHNKTLAALTPVTFEYRYSDGSSQAPTLTTIDPDNLDDGAGGNTAVGQNRWSIQRIYSFVSNNCKLQRGVEDFATKSAAIEGIASEAYITEPSIAANGLLRGWLVVRKGATDLSDSGDAQFINAPKFGESSAGGASTPPGDASVVLIEALKATAGTIPAGSVIRTTGYNGTRVLVELADADAAGEVPALGITREAITDAIAGNVVVFGKLEGIDTSTFSAADTLYISATPGELTNTRPTGATTGIQAIARVLDVDATNGIVEVVGAGRVNALPQMGVDTFWYGDGTGTPAEGTITTAGRAILDDADAAAQRTTLGVGTVQGTDGTYDIQATLEGAIAGGTRGENSVDLQTERANDFEVAGGTNSAIIGGKANAAFSQYSTVLGGEGNTADGDCALAAGRFADTNVLAGARVFADSSITGISALAADTFNIQADALRLVDGNEGAGKVLTCDANGSGNWATPSGGGGGGLTLTDKTADANITAVAGEMHVVEMNSGTPFTASRNWTLPVAASVSTGDQFGLMIKDGDAAFEVNVRTGAAGDLLNGVDVSAASNEWELFQAGEVLIITCIDGTTGDYIVEHDGRIACSAKMHRNGTAQTISDAAEDQIEFTTTSWDVGNVTSLAGDEFIMRRAGKYKFNAQITPASALFNGNTNTNYIYLRAAGAGAILAVFARGIGDSSTTQTTHVGVTLDKAAGDVVEMHCRFDFSSGAATDILGAEIWTYFELTEIL